MKTAQSIQGIVIRGHGVASGSAANSPYPHGTISMQLPFFKDAGIPVHDFWLGTINVSIKPKYFRMKKPLYQLKGVLWTEAHPAETFSFSRCKIDYENTSYSGLIYYPDPSTKKQHFQDPSTIEILAPFIVGIHYGSLVTVELDPEEIELY